MEYNIGHSVAIFTEAYKIAETNLHNGDEGTEGPCPEQQFELNFTLFMSLLSIFRQHTALFFSSITLVICDCILLLPKTDISSQDLSKSFT